MLKEIKSPKIKSKLMLKKLLAVSSLIALTLSSHAQVTGESPTNSPPPIITPTNAPVGVDVIGQFENFLAGAGTNLMLIPYGIYSDGAKNNWGGGLALGYKLNDYVVPAFRIDYLQGAFYQGSITTQLQLPINVGTTLTLFPFGIAGAAMPFGGGSGSNSGSVQGIAGLGLAARLQGTSWIATHLDFVLDWERWSALSGNQYRGGIVIKF